MSPKPRAALITAALLLGFAVTAAPAAQAAVTTSPARPAAAGIFAPCTALQDGQIRYFGRNRYQCVYVWGLGYYWVSAPNTCRTGTAPARQTAAC